jgi:Protein of unknown function DUF262/Protein of unknown function (DUF1524)
MKYQSLTIRESIDRLNRRFFLPALQREFVWNQRQIVRLFDSIMRGYPISSLLFWQPRSSTTTKWASYRFLDEARDGGSHNSLANLSGTNRAIFVLDGQQRLTALNIGLRGIYVAKEKRKWRTNPDAWKDKRLYLDLLHQNRPEEIGDDDETDIQYRFAFWEKAPASTKRSCWFEVGKILSCKTTTGISACIRRVLKDIPQPASKKARHAVRGTLRRLHNAVWHDPVVFYHTETRPDYDRVLDIFVRANEAGTTLSKSDLLLSTITSNWQHEDARKEIHDFVDYLNDGMGRSNYFQKDFVMKACFVLCDLPVKYKITSFTRVNLKSVEDSWPKVKQALENCVRLVNRFGIDQENLTSVNALIPIAYYLFKQDGETLLGSSRWEVRNATAIHRWLVMVLLNRVFSGSSDTMLAALRDVLQRSGGKGKDFPVKQLSVAIARRNRSAAFSDEAIDDFLMFNYEEAETFLALTLLYDDAFWGSIPHHKDHVFPKSHFTTDRLQRSGVPTENHEQFMALKDRIGNLELLTDQENRQKLAQPFEKWVRTRNASFRRKHLIPKARSLYSLKQFEKFLQRRERLIRSRLKDVFAA